MPDIEWLTLDVMRSAPAADGIQLFELRRADGGDLPPFTPGAHISVRTPNGGPRNYSLCGDPADRGRYLLAVKREAGGRGGSISLVDQVKAGDKLDVSEPRNLFELSTTAPSYLFVAGGIGITPILSMIHWVRANGDKPFKLYYLTRAQVSTAFLDELGGDRRVVVHHDLGCPENAFDLWPVLETPTKAHIYCCGPRPLMDAVKDMTGHWPSSQVHFEDFGSDLVRPRDDDTSFTVTLAKSGKTLEVPVGVTIMEAMRAAGLHVPSSCESGTCGTCKTRVLDGEVDHRDLVLMPDERPRQAIICVSRAKFGSLVLDA